MKIRFKASFLKPVLLKSMLLTAVFGLTAQAALAADTIKVGVLHSLSGTMAISETTLKDTVLMLIDEQNKKGGLLGKKLEPVVVDPASNWPLFAEKARELISKDKVSVIFGCWTSVSRKSVLPVIEELNGLLFYPVQYEGEESSKNVIYTGAAPNQQAIPAVDYLMKEVGVKRWVLAGTDDGSVKVAPLICSPPTNVNLNPASHAHEPAFTTFHVFVKDCPGVIWVLSGMVTSLTKRNP